MAAAVGNYRTTNDIVQQIGTMKLNDATKSEPETGKTETNEYNICKGENGRSYVEFVSGRDEVMEAVHNDDPSALRLALKHPGAVELTRFPRIVEGPPMLVACFLGYKDCVKVLLDSGADPLISDTALLTGIHYASLHADMDVLECIFDFWGGEEDINYSLANHRCSAGRTPLHYAALADFDSCEDKREVIVLLLNNGANPLCGDKNHELPSQLCADKDTLKLLLFSERLRWNRDDEQHLNEYKDEIWSDYNSKFASDVEDMEVEEEPNSGPSTPQSKEEPYEIFVNKNQVHCVRFKSGRDNVMEAVLGDKDVDLNKVLTEDANAMNIIDMHRDYESGPPLVVACMYGHLQSVKVLLKFGANVLAHDPSYSTPIHVASRFGYVDILVELFDTAKESKPRTRILANHLTLRGQTPLHCAAAAELNSFEAVKFLLMKGADPLVQDKYMRLPSACCVDYRTQELLLTRESHYGRKAEEKE